MFKEELINMGIETILGFYQGNESCLSANKDSIVGYAETIYNKVVEAGYDLENDAEAQQKARRVYSKTLDKYIESIVLETEYNQNLPKHVREFLEDFFAEEFSNKRS